jgi:hypothetical protein
MKRITAFLGAFALLGAFATPTVVHATPAPVTVATVNGVAVGVVTDNVEWGSITVDAGSVVVAAVAGSGVDVLIVSPQGNIEGGNVSFAAFAALEDNVKWE